MIGYRVFNTKSDTTPRTIEFSEEDMKELDASQFGEFRRLIMGSLKPTMFACMFSTFGRPSCPVDLVIGIMLLACFLGVSEDTVLSQIKGNIYYQYALCMDKLSYITVPSKRTLIRMRLRLIAYRIAYGVDALHEQAEIILLNLALKLALEGKFYRIDSVMLNIYARQLGRSQLLYYVIQGVVLSIVETSKHKLYKNEKAKNLSIEDVKDLQKIIDSRTVPFELAEKLANQAELPEELRHYLQLGDYHSKFYRQGNYAGVSKEILKDATLVWKIYNKTLADKPEFCLFARVLREQCEWVGHLKPQNEKSNVTYSGERVLRFKLSTKERKEAEKSNREVERLENKLKSLYQKKEVATEKFKKAKEKAIAASERAKKAEAKGAANYEALEQKARNLGEKADKCSKTYDNLAAEFDKVLENIGSILRARDEADAFVTVEAVMERDVENMDSNILQSPLDPNATFCEKAGQYYRGYKVTILEISDGKGHSMPCAWTTTQNNVSDEVTGSDLIRHLGELCIKNPGVFKSSDISGVGDGAFSGKEINAALKETNAELKKAYAALKETNAALTETNLQFFNTDLTGQKVPDHVADIEFDEAGTQIIKCAGGQIAMHCSSSHDGMVTAIVDATKCATCKHKEACVRTINGNKATVKASLKQKARAIFQRFKGTEAYNAIGRFRNGVEALMGLFKRKTPVTRQPIYGLYRVSLFNDIAMVATGFSKYLSQKNIPHEEVRLDKEYSELFPENTADVESARMEVERDLRRLTQEQTATQEETEKQDVFYAPMVIPQPNEAEVVDTDTDQAADAKDGEVENTVDTELSATVSGEESETSEGGDDAGTPGNEDAQEDCPTSESQDGEGERPADDSNNGEEKNSAQEHTDAESSKASSTQERKVADPTNQSLGGANSARMFEDHNTNASSVLKRLLEAGYEEVQLNKRSRSGRRVKSEEDRVTATQGKGVGAA